MTDSILGIHHITAITGNAQRNYEFYTKILGLRLVKRTVNFDDPHTYHLYYGNEEGTPGTILTFFPWEGIGRGRVGIAMATEIAYAVPPGSFDFWIDRFKAHNILYAEKVERFDEIYLPCSDPDGLSITLVAPKNSDERIPWETSEVKKETATKGFHNTTLLLKTIDGTAKVLTDIFGYKLLSQEGNRYRFITDSISNAAIIDLLEEPSGKHGITGAGTNHHVAFRVKDEKIQLNFREKIVDSGIQITPKINRDYFYSIYFHEPGGVLFEIATDNPGFTVDEPLSELGSTLQLPKQHEPSRAQIEKMLPVLKW